MRTSFLSSSRRWIGASALAITVALGGVSGLGLLSVPAQAQVAVPPGAPATFADLADAVKPAVVSISIQGEETRSRSGSRQDFFFDFPDLPDDHPFRRFFDQFGDEFGQRGQRPNTPRAPETRRFQAAGSGFIISEDGYVVTNNHVVERARTITVVDIDGDEFDADLIGSDPRTDLALLKIRDASGLPFVTFADEEVRVGDWVLAVGNPFGLGGSVTAGIISARGRDISGSATGDFLQIDAAVNRGNSGGPTFNLEGKVVGVNTAIFSPNGGNVGIAFAIPAAIARQIVEDLKDDGVVTRGFLGVSIQDVTRDIARSVGLPSARGALVTEPRPNSPAAAAGILSGDIITEVDGQVIDNSLALSRTIASKAPGSEVNLTVWRDGRSMSVSVTLDTLPEQQAQAEPTPEPEPEQQQPGPVESSVGLFLSISPEGLVIQNIDPNSEAATKGFAVGDIITEANGTAVSTPDEFENALQAVRDADRSTVLIKTVRNGSIRFVGLPL